MNDSYCSRDMGQLRYAPSSRSASVSHRMGEASARISALSSPCAFEVSVLLNVLLHTSSASDSVWCAAVRTTGRISCTTTSCPRSASCHAASDPARPPPTIDMLNTLVMRDIVVLLQTALPQTASPQRTRRSQRSARHARQKQL